MKRYIALLVLAPLLWGCKSTTPPTAFERQFADVTTNYVTVGTNVLPIIEMKPSQAAKDTAGGVGGVINTFLPGVGSLVTEGLLGALAIWLGYRNRQFKGENDTLSQAAGALAQTIETAREVMSRTPQGQLAEAEFTRWMVTHQKDTDTIKAVADLVKNVVDNQQARKAADQIIALMSPKP